MAEYEVLDLSDACNVGLAFGNYTNDPPIGLQTFHGLSFLIGAQRGDGERCFLGFGAGGAREPIEVSVGRHAHWILIAHALRESGISAGGTVGERVA